MINKSLIVVTILFMASQLFSQWDIGSNKSEFEAKGPWVEPIVTGHEDPSVDKKTQQARANLSKARLCIIKNAETGSMSIRIEFYMPPTIYKNATLGRDFGTFLEIRSNVWWDKIKSSEMLYQVFVGGRPSRRLLFECDINKIIQSNEVVVELYMTNFLKGKVPSTYRFPLKGSSATIKGLQARFNEPKFDPSLYKWLRSPDLFP